MKTQWQVYKELELIPDSVVTPQANKLTSALRLGQVWRSLIDTLTKKLSRQQPIEYLERCLALNCSEFYTARNSNTWHMLWTFLNQPLFVPQLPGYPEPHIWYGPDRAGHNWWHVYDPKSGQTIELETEEEVRIWLEERFYH